MIPGKTLEPSDLLNILRRRREILLPFIGIAALTVAVVSFIPNKYRSETLILVAQQGVPENFVRSTVTMRIEDRLRSLNQQTTSRSRLEPLIRELNLYPEEVATRPMEDVVALMRKAIRTDIIRSDAFRISYTSNDPKSAMLVTERLTSLYIEENLKERSSVAESTNDFLDTQLATAKERLVEQERKLETYKLRYSGQLPAQVQSNLQVMQNNQMQIQALLDSLNRDRDRRITLQRQLADIVGGDNPGVVRTPRVATPPSSAAELDAARQTLAELERRLLETHPDVGRQRRLVADLEKKVADETVALADPRGSTGSAATSDPVRQARIEDIENEIATLTRLIDQKGAEEARLRSLIGEYQGRVEAAPIRESQLAELTRDYETLEHAYTNLLARKDDAQVSANLERRQLGDPFKVLDPARMPEAPISPNRPLFYAAGAALGLGVGLLLAGYLEFRDTSIKTDADVVAVLTLPVLALIPELQPRRRGRQRWRALIGSGGTAALVLGAAGALLAMVSGRG